MKIKIFKRNICEITLSLFFKNIIFTIHSRSPRYFFYRRWYSLRRWYTKFGKELWYIIDIGAITIVIERNN